ncbi:aspartyl-phosphate phosphatase Spo0E family protein [Evansella tamaricis]|uniref:Aspartyl-phosphate phosphatase Spo0E family protein n=1 Tax=Evansella tamaricis TaxID=2069301 RepID=A0ABS6JGQ6_9BACI|nr:aspartyl-phosphate phosphatase Spo0E family protein [Evansella tamaricis]MBU9712828.1 aspartyl-phosphate phosphatase Spo0E family protein [Evansella tamaricis]
MNVCIEMIEQKRNEMLLLSKMYGLTSQQTIQCSQELDNLLNTFQFSEQIYSQAN